MRSADKLIRPQLAADIAESQNWDDDDYAPDPYYPDDFYEGEYTSEEWDTAWVMKAIDLVSKIADNNLSLDEIMESDLQYWYKPDTVVRDDMFTITDTLLYTKYGNYWEHPKSPWTPSYANKKEQ